MEKMTVSPRPASPCRSSQFQDLFVQVHIPFLSVPFLLFPVCSFPFLPVPSRSFTFFLILSRYFPIHSYPSISFPSFLVPSRSYPFFVVPSSLFLSPIPYLSVPSCPSLSRPPASESMTNENYKIRPNIFSLFTNNNRSFTQIVKVYSFYFLIQNYYYLF